MLTCEMNPGKKKNDHRRVEAASGRENGNGWGAISNLPREKEIVK